MEKLPASAAYGRSGRGRAGWMVTAGAASALVLVMALAPLAGATTQGPPYKGWTLKGSFVDKNDCAKSSITTKPNFSIKTGKFVFAATGTAATCKVHSGYVGTQSFVEQDNSVWLGIPEKLSTGAHNLSLAFTVGYTDSGHQSASGSCPITQVFTSGSYTYHDGYCSAISEVEILAYPWVQDNTNGSQITQYYAAGGYNYTQNYTDIYYYCSGSTCTSYNSSYASPTTSFSNIVSMTQTVYITGSFVGSHSYTLIVDFEAFIYVAAEGWTHASAAGSINAGGSGNGITLNSITIT
jgi:hypothetical protein